MKRTPAQRRNLLILRDEILPGIAEGELNMLICFNCYTPACLLGHASVSGRFPLITIKDWNIAGDEETFGLDEPQWAHIFGSSLPNDPSWLAANITDLLESEL